MITDDELRRSREGRKRRQRAVKAGRVVFQKVHRGLYMSHETGMTIDHEVVWDRSVGRKWVLTWSERHMGLIDAGKRSKKFDTVKDARVYAAALVRP